MQINQTCKDVMGFFGCFVTIFSLIKSLPASHIFILYLLFYRTKVYSGNKVIGKIPTLYEMCVHVLQEHIDGKYSIILFRNI